MNAPVDLHRFETDRRQSASVDETRPQPQRRKWTPASNLMVRLLAVSASFVLLTELLVFIPSMAEVRDRWLIERADTAEIAILASRLGTDNGFRRDSADNLVRAAAIRSIAVTENGVRRQLVGSPPPAGTQVTTTVIESQTLGASLSRAMSALVAPDGSFERIVARPRANAALQLDVIAEAEPLRENLQRAAARVLLTTLALAALIATLMYASLVDGFVRPLRGLTQAIMRFRDRPEDARSAFRPSGRDDEIGQAESALSDMQDALRHALLQRQRLALLGTAVSKIAHDLRHSLGSAQLVTERLADVDDPIVRATAPRLERAISRAAGLAEASLRFGKAEEPAPQPTWVPLAAAIQEAADEALAGIAAMAWRLDVPSGAELQVDADQFHRILANLIRNAAQATVKARADGSGEVCATARQQRGMWRIEIADNGPGIPDRVRANLFTPFNASGVSGGSGLGLVIARDLARLNGGDVQLVKSGPAGTTFAVNLPDAAPS